MMPRKTPSQQRSAGLPAMLALAAATLLLPTGGAMAEPQRGGMLVIGQDSLMPRMEPHPPTITFPQRTSFDLYYESLMRLDNDRNLLPSLATEWEQVSPTSYRFRLREGVTFHNGNPFTAADVVYTMERILDKSRPSDAGTKMAMVTSVTAEDDHTVVFELSQPFVPFLTYLASPEVLPILDAESAPDTNFDVTAIGTGPFRVEAFVPGDVMRLRRHEAYWNPAAPLLDGIDIRVIPDDSTLVAALRTGEVQMAYFRPEIVRLLRALPGIEISQAHYTSGIEILLNCTTPGLDDVRVRRALSLSLDYDVIRRTVLPEPGAAVLSWHAPPGDPIFGYQGDGSDIPYRSHDLAEARRLLAEAGYENGLDLEIAFVNVPSLAAYARASQVVIEQAAQVGINIKAVPVDYAAATALQTEGSYVMYTGTGTMIVDVDPDSFYVASHSASARSTCKDPQLDALIEAQRVETDQAERVRLVNEANRYIADQVFALTLFAMQSRTEVWASDFEGYEPRPAIRRWSLQEAGFAAK